MSTTKPTRTGAAVFTTLAILLAVATPAIACPPPAPCKPGCTASDGHCYPEGQGPTAAGAKEGSSVILAVGLAVTLAADLHAQASEGAKPRRDFLIDLEKKAGQAVAVPQLGCVQPAFWYECPRQYRAAGDDRKAIYRLVAGHLKLADRLLAHADPKRRRIGLGIARQAASCAIRNLKDHELAVAICDDMLLSNLDVADKQHWGELNKIMVICTAGYVYRTAGQTDKWVNACRLRLEHAYNRNSADVARLKLVEALAARGDYEEVIRQLEGIDKNGSLAPTRRLIPRYRQKLKDQLKDRKQSNASKKETG